MVWEQITEVSRHKIGDMTRVQNAVSVCVYLVSSVQSGISLLQFPVQALQVLTEGAICLHLLGLALSCLSLSFL